MKKENQPEISQHYNMSLLIKSKYNRPFYYWSKQQNIWKNSNLNEEQIIYDFDAKQQIRTMTLNVLFDKSQQKQKQQQRPNVLYAAERYHHILEQISKTLPHFITLQEVTKAFLVQLEESSWAKKYYYISESSKNASKFDKHGFGNLLLSRIKPIAVHQIHVHHLPRRVIIGFFEIHQQKQRKFFTFSSVHLTAYDSNLERRQKQLSEAVNYLKSYNEMINFHVLQGDFNLHLEEENELLKALNLRDCWSAVHDVKEKPGYTFDSARNLMINEIYWGFEQRRMRLDRIVILEGNLKSALTVKSIELCFNKAIFGNYEESQVKFMFFPKRIISFLFDRFNKNAFRNKEEYLFSSDHFGIEAQFG